MFYFYSSLYFNVGALVCFLTSSVSPLLSLHLCPPLQVPSAGQLMEAMRVKMKERKVLTEELAALAAPVSENP